MTHGLVALCQDSASQACRKEGDIQKDQPVGDILGSSKLGHLPEIRSQLKIKISIQIPGFLRSKFIHVTNI